MHRWLFPCVVLATLHGAANGATVDDERLLGAAADSANWLTYSRDYSNQRFSPLAQVNAGNVKRLVPRWIFQSGVAGGLQATPIVADGVMYLSLPFNHVVALDAASGKELWRYQHKRRTDKMCCGPANRGVAVAYGKVFMGTVDARLIALDAKTGKLAWDTPLVEDVGAAGERTDQLAADDPLRKSRVTGATGVVSTAVQRAAQRADRAGHARMHIGQSRCTDARRERRRVEFVFRVEDQRDVHDALMQFARTVPKQRIHEVSRQ